MAKQARGTKGFTLIEMLVVVSVISILAAIAIPSFTGRQGKAFDARVNQDIRNAAMAQEAYFLDNFEYSSDCTVLPGYRKSEGIVFTTCDGDLNSFTLTFDHPKASRSCTWSAVSNPPLICTPKS